MDDRRWSASRLGRERFWRATLVDNLRVLIAHLRQVGISEVFIDGSFCSDKDRPGDIDGYFVTDFPLWLHQFRQLCNLDPVWDLRVTRPDALGSAVVVRVGSFRSSLRQVNHDPQ